MEQSLVSEILSAKYLNNVSSYILKIDTDKENKKFDLSRTRTFIMLGAVFIAPFLHFNYSYTLPYIAGTSKSATVIALKKIIFDQTVLAPTYFFLFYHFVN